MVSGLIFPDAHVWKLFLPFLIFYAAPAYILTALPFAAFVIGLHIWKKRTEKNLRIVMRAAIAIYITLPFLYLAADMSWFYLHRGPLFSTATTENFSFSDYASREYLMADLIRIFPAGTPKLVIDEALINRDGATSSKQFGCKGTTYIHAAPHFIRNCGDRWIICISYTDEKAPVSTSIPEFSYASAGGCFF